MLIDLKHRKFVQYSLIAYTLLIQIVILVFFYNEYFNENKLSEIREQIENSRKIKNLTTESKLELVNAQHYLNEYVKNPNQEFLDLYFQSLRKITEKIDSTKVYENSIPSIKLIYGSEENQSKLSDLESLIDSTYQNLPKLKFDQAPSGITEFTIEKSTPEIEVEEIHVSDTLPKKKFFPRLKDAISGKVDVKTDTVFITMKYNNLIDTIKVKNDFENALNVINDYYVKEMSNYQKHLASLQTSNNKVSEVYNDLISLSNNLIEVYDLTSDDLGVQLEKQFNERYSKNSKIRRYTVFGLMILLFFVLIIVAYYTKLSFVYEQKLKEANERIRNNLTFKNRILGMLSHEIRSPLKIVNLFINKIYKKTKDESIIDNLKSIRFTNDSLLIQANQILEYTKNQNKQIELSPVLFNLREETDAIFRIFKPYIESVNNEFEIENEIPFDLKVLTDKSKIHQIFINLLGNSNKFTENGKISVNLKTENLGKSNLKLLTEIQDTGIGISEKDIQKIFEPYYKGVISEDVENLGAGLGLNLCKEIIELFQGKIFIESELGKGTSIKFELNLTVSDE
ncbi:MAG: HAMP domain-containing sensor histidine kinase [Weeksellaceae bacterium]|nr:HAMP domain-containing sensor histidine kinase [Weeksellaceae bacterium]